MATRKARMLSRELRTLFNLGAIRDLTDGQLLERYATGGGEGAELAFAALVERHAPMVLRVCRARLVDPHDAQDAAQAAFVVLVQKASSLWVRDSIGPWLHQVAVRTASCSRTAKIRRERLERGAAIHEASKAPPLTGWEDVLHEEVGRLPDRYRIPIILCDLQGHSCEEAARRMGRPVGTIKSWRSRGRDQLRRRLVRLGLAPASVLAANIAKGSTSGPNSDASAAATVRAIMDSMTAGTVSASVLGLAKGVLKAMFIIKLRTTAVAILAFVALAAGVGAVARVRAQDATKENREPHVQAVKASDDLRPPFPAVKDLADTWPLSLREAVRIGLRNSKAVHVVPPPQNARRDSPLVVAPTDLGGDPLRFRSEVMAHVRSVTQQYWALNVGLVDAWAAEKAVELGDGIVKREEAKRAARVGDPNNLAEAREQVDRFKLDLVDRTAIVIVIERQLRNILGVPPTENRRIVPVTTPLDAKVAVDWDDSLKIMMEKQPDIVRERSILRSPEPDTEKTVFQQVVHQATYSLARFTLELDSNHKLFETARRLRTVAADRVKAQATFYETGKITIDRYLDAVNRYDAAVRQEADFQGRYNTAIAAFEEAKGTLLDHEGILVPESPPLNGTAAAGRDSAVRPAGLDTSTGKTFSFQFTIGVGPKPLEVRGSFTVAPADSPKAP